MTKKIEIWKWMEGYEGLYKISSQGNVVSKNGNLLKGWFVNGTYVKVRLYKNKVPKDFYVHRIVAKHFLMDIANKNVVNHIDHNPSNNDVSNLEWCTQKENIQWAKKNNRMNTEGTKVMHIGTNQIFKSIDVAAKEFGINPNTLVCQLLRKSKKCQFMYA